MPLDLLATTPTTKSSEPEQKIIDKSPTIEKIPENGKEPKQETEQEKEKKQDNEFIDLEAKIDPKLLKEWKKFDSIISNPETSKGFGTPQVTVDQKTTTTMVPIEGTSRLSISKDAKIIPKDPSDQIVLQIEDIPPLDVFYSPKHRAVVKRQRKRRRLDQSSLLPDQTEMANVVWKEEFNPSDDLTKLSQYAGAYSAVTIDKASEVSLLLKTKDQEVFSLQAQLTEAKQKAEQAEQQFLMQQQLNNQLTQQL